MSRTRRSRPEYSCDNRAYVSVLAECRAMKLLMELENEGILNEIVELGLGHSNRSKSGATMSPNSPSYQSQACSNCWWLLFVVVFITFFVMVFFGNAYLQNTIINKNHTIIRSVTIFGVPFYYNGEV